MPPRITAVRPMLAVIDLPRTIAFYERLGFLPAPTDPYHLFVLLKDVRAILKQR